MPEWHPQDSRLGLCQYDLVSFVAKRALLHAHFVGVSNRCRKRKIDGNDFTHMKLGFAVGKTDRQRRYAVTLREYAACARRIKDRNEKTASRKLVGQQRRLGGHLKGYWAVQAAEKRLFFGISAF
jgi:hypothetical protein